jgi:integrase
MPRPRPPHLRHETTRHKKRVWYVRVGDGPRIGLKGDYGTEEFWLQYHAAVNGERPVQRSKASAGSLEWLIDRYRETPAWLSLSLATRKQRENILRQVIESAGRSSYRGITREHIAAGRDRRGKTPFQARHFLDTMRGLFAWAKDAGLVTTDPAADVRYPKLSSGAGFPVWTEEEVAAYEARWPLGTRQRIWIAVLLYTGLRRGDAVRIGRQHVRDGIATIRTEKTGTEVHLPILPELEEAIAHGPTADLAFVCGTNGKPMTKESFGNAFRDACRAAGVNKSAHGLRKIGATRAAMNGANGPTLNAIFGWSGSKMASLYTASADRKRLASEHMTKLRNETATNSAAPSGKVRRVSSKTK